MESKLDRQGTRPILPRSRPEIFNAPRTACSLGPLAGQGSRSDQTEACKCAVTAGSTPPRCGRSTESAVFSRRIRGVPAENAKLRYLRPEKYQPRRPSLDWLQRRTSQFWATILICSSAKKSEVPKATLARVCCFKDSKRSSHAAEYHRISYSNFLEQESDPTPLAQRGDLARRRIGIGVVRVPSQ